MHAFKDDEDMAATACIGTLSRMATCLGLAQAMIGQGF